MAIEQLRHMPRPLLLALRERLGPAFANHAQEQFYDSQAPELLYSGAMGAGKSRILCEKAWRLAMNHPGATFGLFRKVAASIPATTLRTFQRDVLDVSMISSRNKQESWYELTNGSRIYFMGLDPDPLTGVPSKVGSLDLAWAGVDEAVELNEGDWIMLLGRLRDPRMPWHQLAAATNPGPPDHWLKQRFTPSTDRRVYVHATAADNRFLPADYQLSIADLPDNAIGRRLGKGEWSAAEGVIWLLPPEQVKAVDWPMKRTVAGLDWGFVHAFACEVVGQSGTGRLSVLGELYEHGLGVDQLAEPLARLAEHHDIASFFCDPSEPGLMSELKRGFVLHRSIHGTLCTLNAEVKPANNDVAPGLQAVDKAIRHGLTVHPSCQGLLSEIPAYTWAPNKSGGFHDRPIDINDDACDALRYAVMAYEPNPKNPWANVVVASGIA